MPTINRMPGARAQRWQAFYLPMEQAYIAFCSCTQLELFWAEVSV